MNTLALILSTLSLALWVFLFVIVHKLIVAMKLAGEALEEIAKLLDERS